MLSHDVAVNGMSARAMDDVLRQVVADAPVDAVLRIRVTGELREEHRRVLRAGHVRAYAPASMNVEVQAEADAIRRRFARGHGETARSRAPRGAVPGGPQLEMGIGM